MLTVIAEAEFAVLAANVGTMSLQTEPENSRINNQRPEEADTSDATSKIHDDSKDVSDSMTSNSRADANDRPMPTKILSRPEVSVSPNATQTSCKNEGLTKPKAPREAVPRLQKYKRRNRKPATMEMSLCLDQVFSDSSESDDEEPFEEDSVTSYDLETIPDSETELDSSVWIDSVEGLPATQTQQESVVIEVSGSVREMNQESVWLEESFVEAESKEFVRGSQSMNESEWFEQSIVEPDTRETNTGLDTVEESVWFEESVVDELTLNQSGTDSSVWIDEYMNSARTL